jgi:hypothetical protein
VVLRSEAVESKALANTRTLASIAIGCAVAIPVFAFLSNVFGAPWAPFLLVPPLWLGQVGLGIAACVVGRRAVGRIDALQLPVELAERQGLHRWAAIGLIVGLLGIVGAMLLAALAVLLVSALGAMGGAWGRPLRIGGQQVGARLGRGTRWADGPVPVVADLDATTRDALGGMWLHDAIKEHGSVPAFAQLTWELAALGAPAALLERCQASALQEIDHARRCFAVAETYLGEPIAVGPIDAAVGGLRRGGGALRLAKKVALETLEDGCLIEDLNADFAERAHELATDEAMRSLTECIAREEREHADLAWDILRWCIALDPAVAAAVRHRLSRLPDRILIPYAPATAQTIVRADATALAAHGRVPFSEWAAIYAHRRAATIDRAMALLADDGRSSRRREPCVAA